MQNRTYRRISVCVLLAILMLGVFAVFLPVNAVLWGQPKLGYVDSVSATPTAYGAASSYVSAKAGSMAVEKVDGTAITGAYLTIFFWLNGSELVRFAGAQFKLYMSKDGYAELSPDDVLYADGFLVSDLNAAYPKNVTKINANLKDGKAVFSLGAFDVGGGVCKVLVGPIPIKITGEYKYIKVWDGVGSIAVSIQYVEVLPTLWLDYSSGPGGRSVTLFGMALKPAEKYVNISYIAPITPTKIADLVPIGTDGSLKYGPWNIVDLKNEQTDAQPQESQDVTIRVIYNLTGTVVGEVVYTEYDRSFLQFKTPIATYNPLAGTVFGNETETVPQVYVNGYLIVVGNYFNPTSEPSFSVDGKSFTKVTFTKPINATGFFNVTLIVPELKKGDHTVVVLNAGVKYVFTIEVLPTLELVPDVGPIGTLVTCNAYGFPEKVKVLIWWYEKAYGDGIWYNVVNGTTGVDGKFNVTVQFKVFHTYGGPHTVQARMLDDTLISAATFTVTPLLVIEPSVIKNDGSLVKAVGTGFDPRIFYDPNIDNNRLGANVDEDNWACGVKADEVGDLNITFIAAGFRPGLHVMSLYPSAAASPYKPAAYALFTVTAADDIILTNLTATIDAKIKSIEGDTAVIITRLGTIRTSLDDINAKVTSIDGNVATISTKLGTVTTTLDNIGAKISSVDGNVATISTKLGTVTTTLDSINAKITSIDGDVATIKTDVGTISGKVTSIDGNVATVKTDVGTIKLETTNAKASADAAKASADSLVIPVYIAVILALIAAIAAIYSVITIRRKIAG